MILLMTVVAAALPQQSETLNAVMIKPGPNAIFGAIFNTTLDFEFTKSVPVPKELRGMRADQIICAL